LLEMMRPDQQPFAPDHLMARAIIHRRVTFA
jgi:hypothetical protein